MKNNEYNRPSAIAVVVAQEPKFEYYFKVKRRSFFCYKNYIVVERKDDIYNIKTANAIYIHLNTYFHACPSVWSAPTYQFTIIYTILTWWGQLRLIFIFDRSIDKTIERKIHVSKLK